MAQEAIEIHGLEPGRIRVTGSPTFDFSFRMRPSCERRSFCERAGLAGERQFIVYLASSPNIAADEVPFALRLESELRAHNETKDMGIVVRPYPLNATIWQGITAPNLVVWPREISRAGSDAATRRDYYDTLFHSSAAVGINTSAFLEAAIVNKPCVAILPEGFKDSQQRIGHFRHLLSGGFLEVANTFAEAATIIAEIAGGTDRRRDARRRFVEEFIRPAGIEIDASRVVAESIREIIRNSAR